MIHRHRFSVRPWPTDISLLHVHDPYTSVLSMTYDPKTSILCMSMIHRRKFTLGPCLPSTYIRFLYVHHSRIRISSLCVHDSETPARYLNVNDHHAPVPCTRMIYRHQSHVCKSNEFPGCSWSTDRHQFPVNDPRIHHQRSAITWVEWSPRWKPTLVQISLVSSSLVLMFACNQPLHCTSILHSLWHHSFPDCVLYMCS